MLRRYSITTSFASLGLSAELLRAVEEQGYTVPTPIQLQAIPVVLAGRDLLGAAQTGTGKTAGFVLPLLKLLNEKANTSHSPAKHPVRALIVTPTRELAAQVEESVRTYGKHIQMKSITVYGGVGMQPQVDALRRGVDILVATPGRLLDHVQQKTVDLRQVEILVLDEADRMLDMGFINDIRKILALLPAQRQNLLFSATFPDEIRKLASGFMKDPVTVEVARRNTPAELVAQVVHPVDSGRKRELLAHLVKSNDWRQVLVFSRTKHGANRLAQQLIREGIEADAIHGNKSQNARTRALEQFKEGSMRVLVATDIAARGLDIEALPHVVNYDLPHVAEDYVHRIGRTGRAGAEGEAVSLVSHEDRPLLAAIERLMAREIEQRVIAGFEPGTGPSRAAEEDRPRGGQRPQRGGRPPQGQRQGAPRGNGGGQPRGNGGGQGDGQRRRPEQGRNRFEQRGPRPQRPHQTQQQRPVYAAAPANAERDAQIQEARARMMEEGEARPPVQDQQPQQPRRPNGQGRPNRQGRPNGGPGRPNGQGRPGQGGRGRPQARSSRQQSWDPRRSEKPYSEPNDSAQRQPNPSRPAPVIQVKQRRTIAGFVGSLLGRKTDDEKS